MKPGLEALCPQVDVPTAALMPRIRTARAAQFNNDPGRGEFGPLPIATGLVATTDGNTASPHAHQQTASKRAALHGPTDDLGYAAVDEPNWLAPDLLATICTSWG